MVLLWNGSYPAQLALGTQLLVRCFFWVGPGAGEAVLSAVLIAVVINYSQVVGRNRCSLRRDETGRERQYTYLIPAIFGRSRVYNIMQTI